MITSGLMKKRVVSLLPLAIAAAGVLSSSTVGAAAPPSWGPVTTLTPPGSNADEPRIALSDDGTRATAAWWRVEGGSAVIQSRSAVISGNTAVWGAVTTLSATGENASSPQVALSADGTRATVVWTRPSEGRYQVQSASAVISGGSAVWGPVNAVSTIGDNAEDPHVALSDDGSTAVAVWRRLDGENDVVQSASAAINGTIATWGAAIDLSESGVVSLMPQVALSASGALATVVWFSYDGSDSVIRSVSAAVSGDIASWGTITDISAVGQTADKPQVSLSDAGTHATAVWVTTKGSDVTIESASATVSGTVAEWGAVSQLSNSDRTFFGVQVALSSDGTKATAVWFGSDGNSVVESASAMINGSVATWSAPAVLSNTAQDALIAQVATSDDGGRALAIWQWFDGADSVIQVAWASVSDGIGTWGTPATLSTPGESASAPDVELSSQGALATALWWRSDGTNSLVQSASFGAPSSLPATGASITSLLVLAGFAVVVGALLLLGVGRRPNWRAVRS